jgi:hypothetical protein
VQGCAEKLFPVLRTKKGSAGKASSSAAQLRRTKGT